MVKVMTKSGAAVRAHSMMYKSVLQKVMLYGSDIWVVTEAMLTVIEYFNHQVAR